MSTLKAISRVRFFVVLLFGVVEFFGFSAYCAELVNLRGYGKISADLTGNPVTFTCESTAKADILLGKLLADLFWDHSLSDDKTTFVLNGAILSVHSLKGYGSVMLARRGQTVLSLSAQDPQQIEQLARESGSFSGADLAGAPAEAYPIFLDFYDNRALKAFIHPTNSPRKLTLEARRHFLDMIGAGEVFQDLTPGFLSPAPGVAQWAPRDLEVARAERAGEMIVPGIAGGGEAPLWEYNQNPDHMMKVPETTLLGQWGGLGMAGSHYESWGLSQDVRSRYGLGFLQQAMERYRGSPAVGGWFLYGGAPGVEFGFHDRGTEAWDLSSDGARSWQAWLRDIEHHSLSDLGERWFGDPKHFKQWDEVAVPDAGSFVGPLDQDSFVLRNGWLWRADTKDDPAGWTPIRLAPVLDQLALPQNGTNIFTNKFDPTSWVKAHIQKGSHIWLVIGGVGVGDGATQVTLNGVAVKLPGDIDAKVGPLALSVDHLLKDGTNEVELRLRAVQETSGGKLAAPIFLTANEPHYMPFLGRNQNARYSDFRQWQIWAMYDSHRKMLTLARQIDPDRPMILSGTATRVFDYAAALASEFGLAVEHTGREAWYHPWWSGLGLIDGFYGAGEESGTAQGATLDRVLSWIMFDADSSHAFFWDVEEYMLREEQDGWFSRHRRDLQLFGKYLRPKPGIVLFRSMESEALGREFLNRWDIGRGELQRAEYDNGYAGELELTTGRLDGYPLIIDTGSQYMEKPVVDRLTDYVKNGGIFIAFEDSGIHSALEPNSSPISALTGFKVAGETMGGALTFGADIPFFRNWQSQAFSGQGRALQSVAPDTVVIARWSDARTAIGYRKIGKGQVIVIGSSFWRYGKSVSDPTMTSTKLERAFFDMLTSASGVDRNADASNPDIWARKMTTKNGIQNWVVAVNSSAENQLADLWMRTDAAPKALWDMETNQPVPFTIADGGVKIPAVAFGANGVKIFGAYRQDFHSALQVWWREKTTYWQRTLDSPATGTSTGTTGASLTSEVISPESWSFKMDPTGEISRQSSWTGDTLDDNSWVFLASGLWEVQSNVPAGYTGIGLYRKSIDVPKDWIGRNIDLSAFSFDGPIFYQSADIFLNGAPVFSYKASGGGQTLNYDVSDKIHVGRNILAIKVTGGEVYSGIAGNIWLAPHPPVHSVRDISAGWHGRSGGAGQQTELGNPISFTGDLIERETDETLDCPNGQLFLEIYSNNQWAKNIFINEHVINTNSYSRLYGLHSRVNVTPYFNPEKENKIRILADFPNRKIDVSSIKLLCE